MTIPKLILNLWLLSLPGQAIALVWWLLAPSTFETHGILATMCAGLLVAFHLVFIGLQGSEWFWRPTILSKSRSE